MSTQLETRISQLRRKIAEQEATLGDLREKLALLLKRQNPADAVAISGLDLLWKEALPKCRERSSRHRCRVAWHRIPKAERPPLDQAIAALKAWNHCEDWTKDRGQFAPGLHRFISDRLWEDIPHVHDPLAIYKPKPVARERAEAKPEEFATPEDIRRILHAAANCEPETDQP